jgi:branched-chain amino acid transport system permease protein
VTTFLQLVVAGISTGSAFAIVGISFVLVYRTTGIVNFAQGTFAAIGGLVAWWLGQRLPLWAGMLLALPLAALVASALAVLAVGIRGRTTHFSSLIVTLGAAFLVEAVLLLSFGDRPRSYPAISRRAWDVGGVSIFPQYVLIAGVALGAAVLLTFVLRHTIVGQALVACSDSVRAAELIGLDVRSIAALSFAVAGVLSAVGGILVTPIQSMSFNSDVSIAINGFAAAVFGGFGSIRLALVGGYVLGIAEQLVVGYWNPQYDLTVALAVMLVLIAWRSRAEVAV